MIRTLKPDEIEVRAQQVKENSCILLLYVDARAGMKILDETFGFLGWRRQHSEINGSLYCTVSLWDEQKKMWIDKQDVGTKSNTEEEKGQASDAFKRALVNVGIARELYSAPFIYVKLTPNEVNKKGERYYLNWNTKFSVSHVDYDTERNIIALQILDQNGELRFDYRTNGAPINVEPPKMHKTIEKPKTRTPILPIIPSGYAPNSSVAIEEIPQIISAVSISTPSMAMNTPKALTVKQLNRLYAISSKHGFDKTQTNNIASEYWGKAPDNMTRDEYEHIVNYFENIPTTLYH